MKRLLLHAVIATLGVFMLTGADSCASQAVNENGSTDAEIETKMSQVQLRMTEDQVRAILGEPNDTQETNSEGYLSHCWYYGSLSNYQLCFDSGLVDHHEMWLTSKNRY